MSDREKTPENLKRLIIQRATDEGRTPSQAVAIYESIAERESKQSVPMYRMIPNAEVFDMLLGAAFESVRRENPQMFRAVPSNELVMQAMEKANGKPLMAEARLDAWRRVQAMSDDAKLTIVGDLAPTTAVPVPPPEPTTAAPKPLRPARDITVAEMNDALRDVYDGDLTQLSVQKRVGLYEGLRAMQPKSDDTAQTLDKLASIRALTPQERLNRHRAGG